MKKNLMLAIGIIWIASFTSLPSLPMLPSFTTVITRITNNTIDVLHGVTDVFQGGLNMLSSTITRIVDGAGTARDKIIRLLEELRKYMQKGIPELGIPILEPLSIDKIEVNIASPKIGKIRFQAFNVEIRGLSEFKIDYVNWEPRNKLTLNITFPRIDVKGNYAVSGKIAKMVQVYGKGPFWLKLQGVSIGTFTQLKFDTQNDPPYYIDYMKIAIKLKKLSNNFTNLMNDETLAHIFNEVISAVTPEALDMLWPELEPEISKQVVKIINEKLKVFQLSAILGRMLNVFTINQGRISNVSINNFNFSNLNYIKVRKFSNTIFYLAFVAK